MSEITYSLIYLICLWANFNFQVLSSELALTFCYTLTLKDQFKRPGFRIDL